MQTRTIGIELTRGKAGDERTVELSFSSETPVKRYDHRTGVEYLEVLSHAPGDVDLSRLNNGHPLLLNHDRDQQVGVIEAARLDSDRKARAKVRFGNSQLATEIWRDVREGIRRMVSVGYQLGKELSRGMTDGVETVRFAWSPYEVSLVAIPADVSVGIGRGQQITETNNQHRKFMNTQELRNEISAIAERLENRAPEVRALADFAITSGMPLEEFRQKALAMLPSVRPLQPVEHLREVKERDWSRYSIGRAVKNLCENRHTGFEAEMSQELARETGQQAAGQWIPYQALMGRSYVAGTGTLGGMAVQTDNLGSQFIELLRNKSQVINLGARVLNLSGPVTIPRMNAAGAANWVGETVASTLSTGNLTQLTLTPQAVSAFQQYSKQLLFESNPSIDSIIRDDITAILGLAIDLAALHGTGSGQPTGIIGTSGIGSVLIGTNGLGLSNTSAYPFCVSLESAVAAANADMGALAYLMRPAVRGMLKTAQRFSSTDSPVFIHSYAGGVSTGSVNGYRAEVTNQISKILTEGTATTITTPIFFGNWSELLVANFGGGVDLVVDPYTLAVNGVIRLIARQWVDVGVRHPASFCVGGGVLNG